MTSKRSRRSSMSRCWRRDSRPWRSFITSIMRLMDRLTQQPAEMAGRILSAARRVGIGMTLLPVFYAHSTFGGAPPRPEQRRFICDLPSFARLVDDCREMIKVDEGEAIGIAPHSLRAVTPSELSELMSIAGGGPIHIHAAEQVKEVEDCVASLGARPVRWLLDHAGVDARWCLVHATHMDEGRDARSRPLGRGRRALSNHGSQSWRWHLQCSGLHPCWRALRNRHRLQRLDWRRRGIAPARICPEIAGAGAECLRSAGRVVRAGRCSRRSGPAAPRP